MKKQWFLIPLISISLVSCDRNDGQKSEYSSAMREDADNAERNDADYGLTAGDQSENEADRTITQNIRKAIVGDSSLSTTAKNVKIITNNGTVTLRGIVNSNEEKNLIEKKAKSVSDVKRVDNQLEVKARG